jgi:hypothetical protein
VRLDEAVGLQCGGPVPTCLPGVSAPIGVALADPDDARARRRASRALQLGLGLAAVYYLRCFVQALTLLSAPSDAMSGGGREAAAWAQAGLLRDGSVVVRVPLLPLAAAGFMVLCVLSKRDERALWQQMRELDRKRYSLKSA